jgi:hypothetical protein
MKKETKVYTVLTHEQALRKQGFVADCDIICPVIMVGKKDGHTYYLEKSIYDKRVELVLDELDKYYGNCEYSMTELKDNIQKIMNGGYDGV